MKNREFDVIVFGATGFTGRLVAEYLLERYGIGEDLRWAVAGRSPGKLDALKNELGDAGADLPSVVADSDDADTLAALAARTSVVLTTVGPYALYGSKLVSACVEAGTDYCDLAGEVQWIRAMIDQHHERARATGARIVHCCGFDSIPMDIGAWFLQQEAHQRFGSYCSRIMLYVRATRGKVSGGTVASMANVARMAREDRSILRLLLDPYALNPDGEREGPDGRDQQGSVFDDDTGSWTAPFVMARVNTRVVRRSHALAGYPWGRDFQYDETVLTGKGLGGRIRAGMVSGGLAGLALGLAYAPTRKLLQTLVLPDPGEGPNREQREKGFFNLVQVGTLPDGDSLRSRITGDRDPGYGSTSKMLAEAAVCLALDSPDSPGGVLTPAAAMAAPLLERLRRNAGLSFDIVG